MQEKEQSVSICSAGIVCKGAIIGKKSVNITADMKNSTMIFEIAGTATAIKLPAADIAAVLNEAIKKTIGKEAKPDERISKTHAGAKSRV